jgi:16S rRNA (uracil1498-N3)-methyltransferase
MDLILQKGTELGITAFSPVIADRTIPLLPSGREEQRLRRWEHIIREAARQCRRPLLPRLNSPQPLATALTSTEEELRLMLWEEGNCPLAKVLPVERPRNAAILVGPEGGFSQQEADAAKSSGFIPVGIGPRILRSETAGFAVAAILQFTYGDLAVSGVRNDWPSN